MATQIAFHSKNTAVQIDFVPAKTQTSANGRKYFSDHGFVLIQMAMGKDKVYDWSKKITFAISISDLPAIYEGWSKIRDKEVKEMVKLVHDPNAGTADKGNLVKTFIVGRGQREGTYALQLMDNQGNKAYHYLGFGEMILLGHFFNGIVPYLIGLPELCTGTAEPSRAAAAN